MSRDYRRSPLEEEALSKDVENMLAKGVIRISQNSWRSPVVLVKKPVVSIRFCVDYRILHNITIKDRYRLPRIEDLLDSLQGEEMFSTLTSRPATGKYR